MCLYPAATFNKSGVLEIVTLGSSGKIGLVLTVCIVPVSVYPFTVMFLMAL
jgi:hypothetical protein